LPGGTIKQSIDKEAIPARFSIFSQQAISITSRITFVTVEYELTTEEKPSDKNRPLLQHPNTIKSIDKATDNTYLHVIADIQMKGDVNPCQVYLSIRAEQKSRHLTWFNQIATYDALTKRYIATINFNALSD
jgi:uncharacterized ferritin-like protein (DUF455 family)